MPAPYNVVKEVPVVREVIRNVYVDRPVAVPTVQKIVEQVPVPVVQKVVEPYAVPVVQKVVQPVAVGIKGPAYESFTGSFQQKYTDDYKSSA